MATTMKDVAKIAGVSTATVSHVINGTRNVSDEVRVRVLDAMTQIKYRPNVLARGLRTKKTNTLALIIPDITNPFFTEFTRGFQDTADKKDFIVFLCNTDRQLSRELRFLELMWQQQVGGVALNPSKVRVEDLNHLLQTHIPIVLIGTQIDHPDLDVVMVDGVQGSIDVVQYLYELGHRRIGIVGGLRSTSSGLLRYQGYCQGLNKYDLPINEQLITEGEFTYDGGHKCMNQLLSIPLPPTAVFATSDVMALGAKRAIEENGLNIPDDISIIGFDDIVEVSRVRPKLSTVAQPIYKMGVISAEILFDRLENNGQLPRKKVVLKHEVVVRESTSAPRLKQ
jgi:DNA-binding LacI/PurR family transcriptional regulator